MQGQRAELSLSIDGIETAQRVLRRWVAEADPSREWLWVLHFDDQSQCLHASRFRGDEHCAAFPMRTIVADAAANGSTGILLAHTHPSGDPTPSNADCHATRRLASAAEALGCRILDHLIYAAGKSISFRQLGLL